MNHITKRNRLEIQLKSLMDFAPICPRNSFLKLSTEMARISQEIEKIKCMTLAELTKPVDVYYDTKPSRVNFIDYIPCLQSVVAPEKIYNHNNKKQ